MKVCKIDGKYYVPVINGKYYAWSKTGGSDVPAIPDTPIEPDVPDVPTVAVNAQLYGNVKNNNGVLSGFDTNSFAVLKGRIPNSYSSAEIVIGFTTGDDITTKQALFDTDAERSLAGWWLYIENGELMFGFGRGSNANSIVGRFIDSRFSDFVIEPNTKYCLKLKHPNKKYLEGYISTDDGVTYTQVKNDYTSTTSDPYRALQGLISLGMAGQDAGVYDTEPIGAFLGTFDLNGSYIKIDDITTWEGVTLDPSIEYEPVVFPNVKLVGSTIQNNNGILSNFSKGSYAVVNYKLPESFTTFEMVVRCTMPNFADTQGLFGTNFEDWNYGMNLGISGNVLYAGFTQNSSATCSINGSGEYWWKYVYDGSTVKAYRKTESSDYVQLSSINITTSVKPTNTGSIVLGCETVLYPDRYNRGTFNLNGCYIKVDDITTWEGVKTS